MEPNSWNESSLNPKFGHLLVSKALRASIRMEEFWWLLFLKMYSSVRDASPEKRASKVVRIRCIFEQILRMKPEENVRVKAFEKSSDWKQHWWLWQKVNVFFISLNIPSFLMKSRILTVFINKQDYSKEISDSISSFSLREKLYLHVCPLI